MVDARSFNHRKGIHVTLDTYEGPNLTLDLKQSGQSGMYETVQTWDAPVKENNFLELHADFTVKARVDNTHNDIIGIAFKNAEPQQGKQLHLTLGPGEEQKVITPAPTRQVTVELFAAWTREVPISAAGNAIVRGQSARIQTSSAAAADLHKWEGTGGLTNDTFALEDGALGSTAVIALGRQDVN